MANYKKPIQRSLLIGCIVFVLSLCFFLSLQSVFLFSSALYAQYDERLDHILTYIERGADIDDLSECVRTGRPSEKYAELQQLLNRNAPLGTGRKDGSEQQGYEKMLTHVN